MVKCNCDTCDDYKLQMNCNNVTDRRDAKEDLKSFKIVCHLDISETAACGYMYIISPINL